MLAVSGAAAERCGRRRRSNRPKQSQTMQERNETDETEPGTGVPYTHHESDKTFAITVVRKLTQWDQWGAIEYTAENATLQGLGPAAVARELDLDPDPYDDRTVIRVADAIVDDYEQCIESAQDGMVNPYGPPERSEPDDSFALAVVRELAEREEWGAIQNAAEFARDMSGLGPVGCALDKGYEPDPHDAETVERIADNQVRWYHEHNTDDDDDDGSLYPSKPDDAEDNHFRRNGGGNYGEYYDEIPGHRIHAELDRLEQAGVVVMHDRVVETADDVHPDYLEIHYGGVCADEIERHRYRHIDSTRDYGVATRPLSELAAHDQEVDH